MNTSMTFLIRSENIATMHLQNDAGALHSPNDIHLYAKVPYGHVNLVLLWSSGWIGI
jgi:hypothetical protein